MFKLLVLVALCLALALAPALARPRSAHYVRALGQGHGSGDTPQTTRPDPGLPALFARCQKSAGREFRAGRGGRQAKGRAIRQFRIDACVRGGGVL